MDDLEDTEEAAFVAEDVNNIIKESIDSILLNASYNQTKVAQWTTNVVEVTLKRLTALAKPFKYVVTCVIMQKNGAGLHTASSCYWDNATDGSRTVRWENKTMYCIATVFGLAI
ncbi:Dynein molecular motor protein light chain 1 [Cymbomonas tetramitiformis]|uniref:Dynein molecular motor protein light chain 1 n=1 Tax=Cymbomonas tetramitiformis TaxID=36881 RepID=A0AAE0F0E8_9CHLO|nr:Dynein molecular motor protein light chain 1 [Cymbomonas tetramitiformis]